MAEQATAHSLEMVDGKFEFSKRHIDMAVKEARANPQAPLDDVLRLIMKIEMQPPPKAASYPEPAVYTASVHVSYFLSFFLL